MNERIRTVALVAPHFTPSNLAGVHRARLLGQHLLEFGWRPIIVTTHWSYYEEELDWGLNALVDPSIEIIRTSAFPTRPLRIIGDIGVRALPWHLAALRQLRRQKRIDFLHVTVPSFFSAALGQLLYRDAPLPFGIDYIDPWVHEWPEAKVKYSKAWVSLKLGEALEPWCVKNAALITGVAAGYYEGVLERNPKLRYTCVTAAMPYGFSTIDFTAPIVSIQPPTEFDPCDGNIHLVYAGALLPKADVVLTRLLEGIAALRRGNSAAAKRLRLHFIGTGKSPNDAKGYRVIPLAARLGLAEIVTEHPHRMSYLSVLAHLRQAFGILVIGSTERHYTPSKVFQSVQSRRPVFALLHEASTAVDVLVRSGAGVAITVTETLLPESESIAASLESFISDNFYSADSVHWREFDEYSARESARVLAAALDESAARFCDRQRGATLDTGAGAAVR